MQLWRVWWKRIIGVDYLNYYVSDLHFGCQNKYENRTLEYDKLIKENWNRVVHNNDNVYILGDIGREGGNKDNHQENHTQEDFHKKGSQENH